MRFIAVILLCTLLTHQIQAKFKSGGGSRTSWSRPSTSHTSHHISSSISRPSSNSGRNWGSSGSPGHSGGSGSHSYPASPGLSGSSGSTGYRPYNPSGGTSVHNPSVGTSAHGYPASSGLSGSGSAPSSHITSTNVKPNYAQQPAHNPNIPNTHSYPGSSGLSGSGTQGHITNTNVRPTYNNPPPYVPYGQAPPAYSPNTGHQGYHPNQGYQSPHGYQPPQGPYVPPPVYSPGVYHPPPVYHTPMYASYHPSIPVYSQPTIIHTSSGSSSNDILLGLAVWNMARSSGHSHDHHYYHNYYGNRNPSSSTYDNATPSPAVLAAKNLSNCTLTLVNENGTNSILTIPCEIASTFTPETPVNNKIAAPPAVSGGDVCTISVVRNGVKEETKIPCDFLTKQAAQPMPGQLNCTHNIAGFNNPPQSPCVEVKSIFDEDILKVIPLPTSAKPMSETTTSSTTDGNKDNATTVVPPTNETTTVGPEGPPVPVTP